MNQTLLIASGVLTIICVIPYLRDIVGRKTKPRLVTWFNWSLLTGIATAAAIADKQWPSAVLTGTATIATMLIVVFGLRYGDTKIETFDVICQLAAILGLILWLVSNDPLVAIVITVAVDFIAGLPTFKHSWTKPHEETISAFMIATVASILALFAIQEPQASGLIYPIYILCANIFIICLIRFSPHAPKAKARA